MNRKIKKIIAGLIIIMSLGVSAAAGCSAKTETTVTEQVTVNCNWDRVNAALKKYDFGKTYYLDPDYEEEEEESGCVSIVNYDSQSINGFKEVPYQLMISYGKTEKLNDNGKFYSDPMITVSLIDNEMKSAYSAVYGVDGLLAEESGDWMLEEDKNTKLGLLLEEAIRMYGLEEQ